MESKAQIQGYQEYLDNWYEHRFDRSWVIAGIVSFEEMYGYATEHKFDKLEEIEAILNSYNNPDAEYELFSNSKSTGVGRGWWAPPKGTHISRYEVQKVITENDVYKQFRQNASEYINNAYRRLPVVVPNYRDANIEGKKIFRGESKASYVNDFANSSNIPLSTNWQKTGTGKDFFYSPNRYEAESRAFNIANDDGRRIIAGKIKTDRMVTKEELKTMANKIRKSAGRDLEILSDLGAFATSLGFSAYSWNVPNNKNLQVITVLDRGEVFMQRTTSVKENNAKENNLVRLNRLMTKLNGGPNSGFHGHSGRPGKVGGSAPAIKGVNPIDRPTTPKQFKSKAITGVDGNESYGTGLRRIPRLDNLSPEQRKLQAAVCKVYEDPKKLEKAMDDYLEIIKNSGKDKLTFETDGVKQVLPGWGTDAEKDKCKADMTNPELSPKQREEAIAKYEAIMRNRQANNSIYHQTANAICKAAFEREAARVGQEGLNIVVTSGGCGAGKGFGQGMLASGNTDAFHGNSNTVNNFSNTYKQTALVWDAAGDQCSSELYWLQSVAKSNKMNMVVLQTNNQNPKIYEAMAAQQIGRAYDDGRMVASKVSADSYVIGNQNISTFYQNNKNDSSVSFYTVGNVGRGYGFDGNGKVVAADKNTKPLSISEGIKTVAVDGNKITSSIETAVKGLLSNGGRQEKDILAGTLFYNDHSLK